ncbi:MAG: hypothetical protein KF713_16625 [Turneriella sp.]|nr:hypothetical protein [Turneriella sp.]
MVGKILEMSPTRVVIKTASAEFVVDPAKIEKVERNVNIDPYADKQRFVEIRTKDRSRFRGTIKRADATTTFLQNSSGEIPIRNSDIDGIEYLDSDKARQADRVAARPPTWELSLKGGSMFYELGTYNNLLSPGYFGLLQIQYPHFSLPFGLRIAPGLQAGYIRNSGKSVSTTKIDLFPGFATVDISYQIADTRFDVFAQGLIGVNLTRVVATSPAERLSLDFAYGAELGGKFHISPLLNVSLAGIWLAVSESGATLNHVGAYASIGLMF